MVRWNNCPAIKSININIGPLNGRTIVPSTHDTSSHHIILNIVGFHISMLWYATLFCHSSVATKTLYKIRHLRTVENCREKGLSPMRFNLNNKYLTWLAQQNGQNEMEVVVLGFAQIRRRLSLKLWSTKACLVQAGFDIRQPGQRAVSGSYKAATAH